MAVSADIQKNFEVVRRGYDIDQVDKFLVAQAQAWNAELRNAQTRVAELESQVGKVAGLEEEVGQARRQQEALTLTFEKAAQTRDEMLAKAKEDSAAVRDKASSEAETLRTSAKTEAERLRTEADTKAREQLEEADAKSRAQLEEAEATAQKQLADAKEEAERELLEAQTEALAMIEKAERDVAEAEADHQHSKVALVGKVDELRTVHASLVASLESIALGGLAAMDEKWDQASAAALEGEVVPPDPSTAGNGAPIPPVAAVDGSQGDVTPDESSNGAAEANGANGQTVSAGPPDTPQQPELDPELVDAPAPPQEAVAETDGAGAEPVPADVGIAAMSAEDEESGATDRRGLFHYDESQWADRLGKRKPQAPGAGATPKPA